MKSFEKCEHRHGTLVNESVQATDTYCQQTPRENHLSQCHTVIRPGAEPKMDDQISGRKNIASRHIAEHI